MPNQPEQASYPPLPSSLAFIHTDNLDLACLLHALDTRLYQITRTAARKAIWCFEETPAALEAIECWKRCTDPRRNRSWETFTAAEKEAAIHLLAGFCNMRKTTLQQAKEMSAYVPPPEPPNKPGYA